MIQLKRDKSHHFYIECNHCKHNAMVPVTSLLNHYGDNITSDEVLRGARCTKGGFQGDSQMRLVFVGKSALASAGSRVNDKARKEVEPFW